jgi:hypothetical protein
MYAADLPLSYLALEPSFLDGIRTHTVCLSTEKVDIQNVSTLPVCLRIREWVGPKNLGKNSNRYGAV